MPHFITPIATNGGGAASFSFRSITRNQFRVLFLMPLIAAVAIGVIAAFTTSDTVVDQLYDMAEDLGRLDYTSSLEGSILLTITYMLWAVMLASHVGVLMFYNWARHLFTMTFLLAYIPLSTDSISISTALDSSIHDVLNLLQGAILAIMYLSPVADYFTGESRVDTPA